MTYDSRDGVLGITVHQSISENHSSDNAGANYDLLYLYDYYDRVPAIKVHQSITEITVTDNEW